MTVRKTLARDLADLRVPWLVPDHELDAGVSLVEEVDGRVVAAGVRHFTRTNATRDVVELHCEDGHGAELLRQLGRSAERPMVLRIIPDTPAEAASQAAGGRVIQSVPAAYFDTAHPDVRGWARTHLALAEAAGLSVSLGSGQGVDELLDLWMAPYLRMHQSWAPTKDVKATRDAFAKRFAQDLDLRRTTVAAISDVPLAAVFTVGPLDGAFMPILMKICPTHPASEEAARAAVAKMLLVTAPTPVEFDGHADEPTYMSILASIPQRSHGKLTPMKMVEIRKPEARADAQSAPGAAE